MLAALALDHYFGQDLDALEATGRMLVRRLPFERLRRTALKFLGPAVAEGLSAFNDPSLEEGRQRYATWLKREIQQLYRQWPFEVVILPSDIFFYVRAMPDAAHDLGVPVVVVQKETTISPDTLEHHSQVVRAEAPFISDYMTVCSERQREFWIRAGADAQRIAVTGQPRFDTYANPAPHVPGVRVLFLSYELDAYEPGVGGGQGRDTWKALRDETEGALFALARRGDVHVTVKLHPQQSRTGEFERLVRLAGQTWGREVQLADPESDTRDLIANASVVVGFQTTALYEAVAAGKPTVYAAWGNQYESARHAMLPFHSAPRCVAHATSSADLERLVLTTPRPAAECRSWTEQALGPIDGNASSRVITLLERVARQWERKPAARHSRGSTAAWLVRSAAVEAALVAGAPLARAVGKRRGVDTRLRKARSERRHAQTAMWG